MRKIKLNMALIMQLKFDAEITRTLNQLFQSTLDYVDHQTRTPDEVMRA